ncbi:MAG: bifunctional ornithine acetyltransferase/N-acetylglutamate synthase [Clostridia bacterium]|nr:bifunctional ornithine acetyltransferase/N-acetylglutamate synthase [Clostridia bacterium]
MRKNGVNRTLTAIEGGVCAPSGFRANGVHCGIAQNVKFVSRETKASSREDLSLILADGRYPTTCVFASERCGASARISKKHIQTGYARAVIANSGIANAFGEGAEGAARAICRALAKSAKISEDEIVIASTGRLGVPFCEAPILEKTDELVNGAASAHNNSLAAARALMTTDMIVKQLAFSFEIGDITCKIGAICKGNARVSPNMATTLCFVTTDVNISPKALSKAFSSAVNDTLNMLTVDGIFSPNDCACIMASGRAGNYIIDRADSEYEKFTYALKETLFSVCRMIVTDNPERKSLVCKASGARSVRAARTMAKAVVSANGVKHKLSKGVMEVDDLLCALCGTGEAFDLSKTEIAVGSRRGALVLFEEGKRLPTSLAELENILGDREIEVDIRLNEGNYQAKAIGNDG